jgi:hypothetical protein
MGRAVGKRGGGEEMRRRVKGGEDMGRGKIYEWSRDMADAASDGKGHANVGWRG